MFVRNDGRCTTVRSGDTVHYTLTVEAVGGARGVYGDLRLRMGRTHELTHGDLPLPDFRSLGGGGLGTRDSGDGKMYHFAFVVPKEILGGTYRGVEVFVRADQPITDTQSLYHPVDERVPRVEVTRHTRNEVHAYCLNVVSSFGVSVPNRPFVTHFAPGPVDPPPTPPSRPPSLSVPPPVQPR